MFFETGGRGCPSRRSSSRSSDPPRGLSARGGACGRISRDSSTKRPIFTVSLYKLHYGLPILTVFRGYRQGVPLRGVVTTSPGPPVGVVGPRGGLWADIRRSDRKMCNFHYRPCPHPGGVAAVRNSIMRHHHLMSHHEIFNISKI